MNVVPAQYVPQKHRFLYVLYYQNELDDAALTVLHVTVLNISNKHLHKSKTLERSLLFSAPTSMHNYIHNAVLLMQRRPNHCLSITSPLLLVFVFRGLQAVIRLSALTAPLAPSYQPFIL